MRKTASWFVIVILAILSFVAQYSTGSYLIPSIPKAHATTTSIILTGCYFAAAGCSSPGWNNSNPGPTMTATKGDSISITLISGDQIMHTFVIDVAQAGVIPNPNCSVDKCSGSFSSSKVYPFTVDFGPGTYTYYCSIHTTAMIGTFKVVQPGPDYTVSSNPTSLPIVQGSNANSTIIITSINNFAGTINLSASSSPSGPTPGFNTTTINVPAGGTAHSKLTVSTTSGTPLNSYTITVTAKNSTTFSRTTTLTISVISPTSTQVVCIPGSVVVNQASTCTATVTDTFPAGATTPGGGVTFTLTGPGSLSSNSCMLASGYCSVAFTSSTSGTGTLTGRYNGDSAHNASVSTPASIIVNLRSTTTSVNCATPIGLNQPSTCTAVVTDTSTAGTVVTPTGAVTFTSTGVGSVTPSSCTLNSGTTAGTASCYATFTSATPGAATATANYSGGNMIHAASMSTPASITVTGVSKHDTTTNVSCETPVVVNQGSNCTATVADTSISGSTTPTGTVAFTSTGSGSLSPTSCVLSYGSCSVTFTPSSAGTDTVTGSYGGDSTHNTSVSPTESIAVNARSTNTSVLCTGLVVIGQASSCTATVSDSSPAGAKVTPTGSVSFASSGLGSLSALSCTLISSSCSVTFTGSALGSSTITGTYGGDASHSGSSSTPSIVNVNERTSSTVVSCINSVIIGQASSCTATVTDTSPGTTSTPSGSITFTATGAGAFNSPSCSLVSGSCSVTFTPSATGTATVTARYGGDSTHNTSTSAPSSISIPSPDFSMNANPTSLSVAQGSSSTSSITLSAQNGFTGAVALTASSTSGITVTFTPTTIYPRGSAYATQTSTMTVNVDSSVAAGSYTITVTGTSGSLTHHVSVPLRVNSSPSPVSPAPTILGLAPIVFYGIVGGVVAVVAVGAGVTILLRRRKP